MAKRIYITDGNLVIVNSLDLTDDIWNVTDNVYFEKNGTLFVFYRKSDNFLIESIDFSNILDVDGVAYDDIDTFMTVTINKLGKPGAQDVVIQSSTSPLVIIKATDLKGETTLSALAVEDAYTFTVVSTTGAVQFEQLTVYSVLNNRVSFFTILNIVGNVITVDTPIDFAYESGSFVQFGSSNLAVDGSVTPVIFGIRNPTAQDIEFKVDFTRTILSMQTTTLGNLSLFGNIPALTKGLVCRFVDGRKQNIFNVKTNREIDNLMFDFKFIPTQGGSPDGLSGRFTFEKLGSVIRLRPFEDLQFIVQDNLATGTPNITLFEIILQGAGVTD